MRCAALIGVAGIVTSCFGQAFQGLGVVAGQNASVANAISADGTTVVGSSQQFGGDAWRWTASTGRVDLGIAPSGYQMLQANDVSADGATVVGAMQQAGSTFAWRWTQTSGIQRVVGVGATFGPSISSDGSTIVGQGEGGGGVRWTQAIGAQSLGPVTGLPIGNGGSIVAFGVSANGATIVGPASATSQTNPPQSTITPYRWTQATGAVGILNNGQLYNPADGAGASGVSDDGARIVGYTGNRTAWLWTESSGYQAIVLNPAPIPGRFIPSISGDGMTIAYREFIWTNSSGTQLLTDALTSAGCNFTGWTDLRVIDTSFNGRTLCGYGTNPSGQTEAWYATIPTPSSAALLGLCGSAFALRRRRSVCQLELA